MNSCQVLRPGPGTLSVLVLVLFFKLVFIAEIMLGVAFPHCPPPPRYCVVVGMFNFHSAPAHVFASTYRGH